MKIEFSVVGVPQTAGSKRAFPFSKGGGKLGVRVTDDNPKGKGWRWSVVTAVREVYRGILLEGPLSLCVTFVLPRPKGHYGKTGLRKSAPRHPIGKPDALKLTRALEDALSKIVWRDDSQIIYEVIRKSYGHPPGAIVVIEQLSVDGAYDRSVGYAAPKV